jgi:hypothetical protein
MLSEFCLNCGVFSELLFAFVSHWHLKQGVCHTVALPYTLKRIFKAKEEELWKLKYFTMQKYINLQTIL